MLQTVNPAFRVCLAETETWAKIPTVMELGLMMMVGSGYTGPRPRQMQISISSVHIFSVLFSVSGSVN